MNIQDVMEEKAKELIGNWGYEEEYWWKPIKEALLEIYQQGRKDGEEHKTMEVFAQLTTLKEEARVGEGWTQDGGAMTKRIQKVIDSILSH